MLKPNSFPPAKLPTTAVLPSDPARSKHPSNQPRRNTKERAGPLRPLAPVMPPGRPACSCAISSWSRCMQTSRFGAANKPSSVSQSVRNAATPATRLRNTPPTQNIVGTPAGRLPNSRCNSLPASSPTSLGRHNALGWRAGLIAPNPPIDSLLITRSTRSACVWNVRRMNPIRDPQDDPSKIPVRHRQRPGCSGARRPAAALARYTAHQAR